MVGNPAKLAVPIWASTDLFKVDQVQGNQGSVWETDLH